MLAKNKLKLIPGSGVNLEKFKLLEYPNNETIEFLFISRIMKEKGIEDAVNAVKAINRELGRTVYTLDIYGQVDNSQTEWFKNLQKTFPSYIRYRGLVSFEKSVEIIFTFEATERGYLAYLQIGCLQMICRMLNTLLRNIVG